MRIYEKWTAIFLILFVLFLSLNAQTHDRISIVRCVLYLSQILLQRYIYVHNVYYELAVY